MTVLRTRIVEAAGALTGAEGWGAVTMGRLAAEVGVSRQTVYNEVGGKEALAEAMVLHELDRFLAAVDAEMSGQDDVVEAVRRAANAVLTMAADDPLLRAVLSSTHGAGTDLLPLLTTHSAALLDTAAAVIRGHLEPYDLALPAERLEVGLDMVVRLVLSHVMQPRQSPERTADDIAWVAGAVLRPT
ncbi:TetR/AcrR family transcriptional regulator [Nocardioides mangrovicus]|uniref:TetR/AcrR family transcriptional regulator n=1 Tax=Nocardioides mangrovicus TaxID=2478913 RepID=UPI001E2A9405|nr:TetR family transcriptional regulator [Nocardioides mangrovicus]